MDEIAMASVLTGMTGGQINDTNEIVGKKHALFKNDEFEVYIAVSNEDNTKRTCKRVKRGKCSYCKNKTTFFCPSCKPVNNSKKAWFCGNKCEFGCHEKHLKMG